MRFKIIWFYRTKFGTVYMSTSYVQQGILTGHNKDKIKLVQSMFTVYALPYVILTKRQT